MKQYQAPNGELIVAIKEMVPGSVGISSISDDGKIVDFDNAGTNLWWDESKPATTADGKSFIFLDGSNTEYTFDQLKVYTGEDDDEPTDQEVENLACDLYCQMTNTHPTLPCSAFDDWQNLTRVEKTTWHSLALTQLEAEKIDATV